MRRRLAYGPVVAVTLACMTLASGAQAATVTIGQLFAPSGACSASTILQPAVASGTSYVVPGAGVITSWSFQTDAATSPGLKFKVGRSAGAGSYRITAEATAGPQTPNAVNAYPVSVPVQAAI